MKINKLCLSTLLCFGVIQAYAERTHLANLGGEMTIDLHGITIPKNHCYTLTVHSILYEAILQDSATKVEEAIQAGIDIHQEENGKTPLLWAIEFKHVNAVRALVKHGAQLDQSFVDRTMAMQDFKTVIFLVKYAQLDINTCYNGIPLAQYALVNRDYRTALFFMQHGSNMFTHEQKKRVENIMDKCQKSLKHFFKIILLSLTDK